MPRNYKRDLKCKVYRKPDPENMSKAIEAIENKKLSIRKAAAKFNIHYSVVNRHYKKRNSLKPQGGQTALNTNEEAFIVDRIKICADWGYPIDSFALRNIVKEYLNSIGKCVPKFKNNYPGKDFAYSFLKRHKKELSLKLCQNIKRKRAAVSREEIIAYFDRLETELINIPPENIVNYDETNLRDDPGKKKVIVKRGCKYPERVMNSSKSSTSVMFSCGGDGTLLPVYVVYKAVHLYDSWTTGGPQNARYNRTKSGWFDGLCFEDWIRTVAVPYLKNKKGKKFLIGDNLAAHLNMESIRLCLEHDIHFIFLPPNSTHLTQVLDVAFFAPLKCYWRQILEKWKMGPGRKMSSIPKDKFPRLLKSLLKRMEPNASANVRAGFEKCGIVPIDREQVLKMLPAEIVETENPTNREAQERQHLDNAFMNLLKSMRYDDDVTAKPTKKSKLNVPPGKSISVEDLDGLASTAKVKPKEKPKRKLKKKINPRKKIKIEEDCSESSQYSESENTASNDEDGDLDSEIDDENADGANNISSNDDQIMETYPFPTKAAEIKKNDWLAVNFFYSVNKASSSKSNARTYIGKVTEIRKDKSFTGTFLRSSNSRDHPGFIYKWPNVQDVSTFPANQVVGKLRPPEKYGRGLLKFDLNIENL